MKSEQNSNYKHGLATNGKPHPIYIAHKNMMTRCYKTNSPKYHRYGGRGIKVCEEWKTVKNFYNWAIQNGWEKGLTLDRINNDGDYKPENCQWISLSENSGKNSLNKLTLVDVKNIRKKIDSGEFYRTIAKEYGVNSATIWFIMKNITHKKAQIETTRRIK